MERGDISDYTITSQACVWEGVLANPPAGFSSKTRHKLYERSNNWVAAIPMWKPNDLAVKSLVDCVSRLRIATDVITFLPPEAIDPIYNWLLRKGITTPVFHYDSAEEYAQDLRYNRGIKTVYVGNDSDAMTIGLRAHVVQPNTAWRI